MEINIILFICLLAYSLIVSQSFSYIIALRNVQQELRVSSYIELRQLLDKNFRKKFSYVVYLALLSCSLLLVLSSMNPTGFLFISVAIAWLGLVMDTILTLTGNMPINKLINTWNENEYPPNWSAYREKWLSVFSKRQFANIIGFLFLLLGAVFG